MIKVLFICHGNICRSPMAEFVLKDIVSKRGLSEQFVIHSAATSIEEIGNPIHYGTVKKLKEQGIPMTGHRAAQIKRQDYDSYDYLIGMDAWNIRNMKRILGEDSDRKLHLLLEFTKRGGDIADPWYTGDFDETYEDICEGCEGFIQYLKEQGQI